MERFSNATVCIINSLIVYMILYSAHAMTQSLPSPILVYNGPGVNRGCFVQTLSCLQKHLTPDYPISITNADNLREPSWIESTRLLVMPGGADKPYVASLEPRATDLIRQFVRKGGIYFGLCAGAYFATKRVEFEVDRPDYAVIGDRDLALINAIAKGAAFPGFIYGTEHGARAANVKLLHDNEDIPFYFNGGPYFDIVDDTDVEVIGRYEDGRAAIVKSKFGDGLAILSGVHIEFDPETMESTPDIIEKLQTWNGKRIQLLSYLKCLMNL